MLTILIRTSYRPLLFKRLIASIPSWCKIIVSYDDERALSYIGDLPKIRVYPNADIHAYDNYVNDLKDLVTEGFFMVVDDDDIIIKGSLEKISLQFPGIICQFSRAGKLKPSNSQIQRKEIKECHIGMPCLILHHSLKNLVDIDGSKYGADYIWIKKVSEKVQLKFVAVPVVYAEKRSRGVMTSA